MTADWSALCACELSGAAGAPVGAADIGAVAATAAPGGQVAAGKPGALGSKQLHAVAATAAGGYAQHEA